MKTITFRVCALFCIYAFVAGTTIFFSHNTAVATYADKRTSPIESVAKPETRCGWFSNPTPGNAWLLDRNGEWLIAAQGGYQAEGDWADFKPSQWVKTNINYGYGCSCMTVTTDKKTRRILTIKSATARPLSVCRKDKRLKEPKD